MKKKIVTNINTRMLTFICTITVFSLLFTENVVAECLPGQINCNPWIAATSSATAQTGQGGSAKDYEDRFPNVANNEVQSLDIFRDSQGNVLKYKVNDWRDAQFLIDAGVPESMILYSDQYGNVTLPTGSIENKEEAEKWQKYYDSLKNDFAVVDENGVYKINPNSEGYRLGVELGLYTGDVEKDSKALLEGNTTGYEVMKASVIIIDGVQVLLTSENADTVCARYIDNYNNTRAGDMGSYCRAIRDSYGEFSDEGEEKCMDTCYTRLKYSEPKLDSRTIVGRCCLEENGADAEYGKCCMYLHTPEECSSGNQDNGDDDDDDNVTCPVYDKVVPIVVSPPNRKNPIIVPGTCGGTYSSTTYDYDITTCDGLVVYEKKTVTSVTLPDLSKSLYYAGETFNWRRISSNQIITVYLFDTSKLQNKISALEAQIKNIDNQIASLECQKNSIDINGNCEAITDASAKSACQSSIDNAKQAAKDSLDAQIENLKNDESYINAKLDLEKYRSCQTEAAGSKMTSTSNPDVASLNSNYISFSNTNLKYNSGEVVAIDKNNGNPLTLEDMKQDLIEKGAYLTVKSDFYVPTTIKNGTSLIAHRDISYNGGTFSYECNANVANYFSCDDDDCVKGTKIIYRPISLTNPFPYTKNEGSYMYRGIGANWSKELAETYILNNRNVNDYNVYSLTPLYTITLTPSDIKEIRQYNKKHSYNDFNLTCTDGYNCLSKFLWEDFNEIIDTGKSCAKSSGWDMSCYGGGVAE